MRAFLIVSVIALSALGAMAQVGDQGQWTWNDPLPDPVPYNVDTGMLTNAGGTTQLVHQEVVNFAGGDWMRLYFGDVVLGEGSYLRITSEQDGEVQELDAEALAMWSNTSGYFNGETVTVELIAGPQTQNRLVIEQAAWEDQVAIPTLGCDPGCCGPTDDRVPSEEDWSNRLVPAGCTASIYNTDSCAVSAGHCASGGMVLEFKVPLSNPNCSNNHPPISEQFPVTAFQFTNGGPGNDWLAMTVGTNNLGEEPFERYGEFRPIGATPPVPGQPAAVWGYGDDDTCPTDNAQQTSDGFIESVQATLVRYSIDVTFGNSGSGVLRNGQEIVGIVTHCCCPNQGTRMDHPNFVAAREALCPTSAPEAAPLISANVLVGTPVSGSLADLLESDDSHFVVDSVPAGIRNNAATEIVAQSPATTVNELNVTIEYGPGNASPVFILVQLFNNDTGTWNNLHFGITSSSSDTVVDLDEIGTPNAYIDGSGQVRIRAYQTARQVQTPDGFTQLLDHVAVSIQP